MSVTEYIKLAVYLVRPDTVFVRWISHALGDNLLLSVILPEARKKFPDKKIIVETKFPELFLHNPYVDWVTDKHIKTTKKFIKPKYRIYKETKKSIYEQMLSYVSDKKKGAPQLFLTEEETAKYATDEKYFVITPVGKMDFSANRKEWGFENFRRLAEMILATGKYKIAQIGSPKDKLLEGAKDMRGLPVRESASVIKNSCGFIGLEGGLMHLSRAVNVKSLIIYGGFINPEISGYDENVNIANLVDCSPCFTSEQRLTYCDSMKCMKQIKPEFVFEKLKENFFGECEQ